MQIDKSSACVRAMFEEIAPTYDLLNHLLSANRDACWRARAVSRLAPRRDELILDLCCGTGDLGLEVLRQQPACRVVGADFAVSMLVRAVDKGQRLKSRQGEAKPPSVRRRGHQRFLSATADTQAPASLPRFQSLPDNPNFAAADALHLPFPDACFDAVAVGFGVRNFEDTRLGMCEIQRVLKPGGKLLVLEFMRHPSGMVRKFFGAFNIALSPVGRMVSKHPTAYAYLPASVNEFYSKREFAVLLREVGFGNVRLFDHTLGVATSTLATKQ